MPWAHGYIDRDRQHHGKGIHIEFTELSRGSIHFCIGDASFDAPAIDQQRRRRGKATHKQKAATQAGAARWCHRCCLLVPAPAICHPGFTLGAEGQWCAGAVR